MNENQHRDKDLYEILGVEPTATTEEIREARTRLIKRYHPDKGGLRESDEDREFWTARTAEINDAWEILKDQRRRREYDRERRAKGQQPDKSNDEQERDSAESAGADEAEGNNRDTTSEPQQSAKTEPPRGTTRIAWGKTAVATIVIIAAVITEAQFQVKKQRAIGQAATATLTTQLALPVPHNVSLDFVRPLRYGGRHGDSESGFTYSAGQPRPPARRAGRRGLAGCRQPRSGRRARV